MTSLRQVVALALVLSGMPALLRWLTQRRRVTIVMFHDPSPAEFERHARVLLERYSLVALKDAVDALRSGALDRLPPWPLVMTFDDGHASNFALLEQLKLLPARPTIFLCSGIVGTDRGYWFRCLPPEQRSEAFKRVGNDERQKMLGDLGFAETEAVAGPRQALSAHEIEVMAPWVDFGGHSAFHPCLPQCDDRRADAEIRGCRVELAERFGVTAFGFAYPNGDWSPRDRDLAEAAGFGCAVTIEPGVNAPGQDLYRLKRMSMHEAGSAAETVLRACGLWACFRALLGGT